MDEKIGWIKLHRKMLTNPIAGRPAWAWLWIVLLLLANHDEKENFIWMGKKINLKRGQFITGRKKLKQLSGVPETTIERVLDYLEKDSQIGQQKKNKFRLITITNWDKYQISGQQTDNKRTQSRSIRNKERIQGEVVKLAEKFKIHA